MPTASVVVTWRRCGSSELSRELAVWDTFEPPITSEQWGLAVIFQPRGRRRRLYVRGFLRLDYTDIQTLLPPKMAMELGVHRVHGRSDGAACGDDPAIFSGRLAPA